MKKAFTLIEVLVVIAIIGILAAIGFSTFIHFGKADKNIAAENRMVEGLAVARHSAIANRSMVYCIFFTNKFEIWTARQSGDQIGQPIPILLSTVELPEGQIIAPWKFLPSTQSVVVDSKDVYGFNRTNFVSFTDAPYLIFDSTGKCYRNEDIPLASGNAATGTEDPSGNSTAIWRLIHVDEVTGVSSVIKQEVK